MNLSFFISNKLIRSKHRAFSALIMRISIIATTMSVAAMIVSVSFVNGFQKVVADKIFDFWGDLRIEHYEPIRSTNAEAALIVKNDTLEKLISNQTNIESISPFITQSAILSTHGTIEGVMIKGINSSYPNQKIKKYLRKGFIPDWRDSLNRDLILISSYTASQLKADTGQAILVYFIAKDGTVPRFRKMKIAGIFSTGMDIYDQNYSIGNLDFLNKVNKMDTTAISGYEIHVKDKSLVDKTSETIFSNLPLGWNAITLKELSPEIFDWLKLQDTNKFVMIGLMLVVALINLITCLIILLLERSNMIAVLKSLGAKDGMVQRVFVYYGSWIATIGIFSGTVLGIGVCLAQIKWSFIKLNEEVYYVKAAPVYLDGLTIAAIVAGTLLTTATVLILPSIISKKINISKALQFK